MKFILILLILCNASIFSQNESDFYKYYNIYNENLKICPISEDEVVFYGTHGGVLRTYDGGETWHQNFSGTHSWIKKMIYLNEKLYAVTLDGEFMISEDKGDYWKLNKLSNGLSDICFLNDKIVISDLNNILHISVDNGKTWQSKQTAPDSITSLMNLSDKLIITTQRNKVYYSEDIGDNWTEVEIPFINNWIQFSPPFEFNNEYDNLLLIRFGTVGMLKNDLTWELDTIAEDNNIYYYTNLFPDEKNYIYTPVYFRPGRMNTHIYKFDINKKENIFIDSINNFEFGAAGLESFEYIIETGRKIDNKYYFVKKNKGILTTTDLENFEVKYNLFYETFFRDNQNIYFDDNNWIIPSNDFRNFYLYTTDGGKNFINSMQYFDKVLLEPNDVDSSERKVNLKDFYFKSIDEGIIRYHGGRMNDNRSHSLNDSRIKLLKTKDRGKTFEFIHSFEGMQSLYLLDLSKIEPLNNLKNDFKIIEAIDDKYFITKYDVIKSTAPKNQFDAALDSIVNHSFLFLHDDNSVDSIAGINDSLRSYNFYIEDDFIWFYGNRVTTYLELLDTINYYTLKKYKLAGGAVYKYSYSKEKWDLIKEENLGTILKSKNGSYFTLTSNKLIERDDKLEELNLIELDFDKIQLFKGQNRQIGFLEDKIFQVEKNGVIQLINIDLSTNEKYKVLDIEYSADLVLARDNKSKFYNKDRRFFYIPIEPERLEYYASSVERGGPPPIWTYPPYPNPVKDRLKMKFYSAMMGEIAKLKVELIHIGTGRVYHIDKYGLNIIDDNWGEIEIDITGYIRGAYLINFKLGDGNKSESIIIE